MFCQFFVGLGSGRYPTHDPWNRAFTNEYCKTRFQLGGQPIAGKYKGILDGIQADQDFVRILFKPSRSLVNSNFSSTCFLISFLFLGSAD